MQKTKLDKLPIVRIVLVLCILAFIYGFVSHKHRIFPYTFLKKSIQGMKVTSDKLRGKRHWYYQKTDHTKTIPIYNKTAANNGLTLVTSIKANDVLSARIINMEGQVIHEWVISWDKIWPDATHIPEKDIPKSKPGTHIHGAVLMDNGDLVFNFEHLGLVRLDLCNNIVWRLPYKTHHSIYLDEHGNLWVPGRIDHNETLPEYPNLKPIFHEPTVLEVSPEGKILKEISILDILIDNNLQGLLYMKSTDNWDTSATGDILHLNDVETFPTTMKEGVFKAGDIMISLRNINLVFVVGQKDLKIKHMNIGGFVRQHDPDFIDGNTISIFDNNNFAPEGYVHYSKILIESAINHQSSVYYTGTEENPFYTDIMGKHQWLPNGNLLITESMKGKAFEIDREGKIVWEYINIVDKGYVGIVEQAQRLRPELSVEFYEKRLNECQNPKVEG